MSPIQSYFIRYFAVLAVFLSGFSLFALFAAKYLLVGKPYLGVFCRACTFFGVPLIAYTLFQIIAEEENATEEKKRNNVCLFLASLTVFISGIIFFYL